MMLVVYPFWLPSDYMHYYTLETIQKHKERQEATASEQRESKHSENASGQ